MQGGARNAEGGGRKVVTALARHGLGLMLYAGARRGAVRCGAWAAEDGAAGGCEAAIVPA